jgi:hypothetical protein
MWMRGTSSVIAGAINSTYTLTALDYNKTVWVEVSRTGYYGTQRSISTNQIGGTFTVGETGPSGGMIFFVNSAHTYGTWTYLEAAPQNVSSVFEWGFSTTEISGASGTAIGTGKANTQAIIDAGAADGSAARRCKSYGNEWFLPSRDELYELYEQKSYQNLALANFCWSSSQYNDTEAYAMYVDNGGQVPVGGMIKYPKTTKLFVRPIRSF